MVWLSPILPFINDTRENIEKILQDCMEAEVQGILCFHMGVTLRDGNREYFYQQLDKYFHGMKERYIRAYGNRYELNSSSNEELLRFSTESVKKRGSCMITGRFSDICIPFEEKKLFPKLALFDWHVKIPLSRLGISQH